MAKKGMSLNPGADTTLVQAAQNAAMANVPKDLSGTFEAMAKDYGKTMELVGEAYGQAAQAIGKLAGPVVKSAIKNIRLGLAGKGININKPLSEEHTTLKGGKLWSAIDSDENTKYEGSTKDLQNDLKAAGFDPGEIDGVDGPKTQAALKKAKEKAKEVEAAQAPTNIGQLLKNIRKERSSLLFKFDAKSMARKNELKAEKEKLYSQIEWLGNSENFNNQLLSSGNYDPQATGALGMFTINALQAYSTPSGIIKEGPFKDYKAVLNRDNNKDLFFTFVDPSGKSVTGIDPVSGKVTTDGDKAYKITGSEIEGIIIPTIDKETVKEVSKNIFDPLLKSKSKFFAGTGTRNKMREYVLDEKSLFGWMQKPLGSDKFTFIEKFNMPSELSASVWTSLGSENLKKMGVKDIGAKGFSREDFTAGAQGLKNFGILKDAILNRKSDNYNFATTQSIYLDEVERVGKAMWRFDNSGSGSGTHTVAGQMIPDATFQQDYMPYINFLKNPQEGQEMQSPKGFIAKYEDGEWTINGKKKMGEYEFTNAGEVAKLDGLFNYVTGSTGGGGGGGGSNDGGGGDNPPPAVLELQELGDGQQGTIDFWNRSVTVKKMNGQWYTKTGYVNNPWRPASSKHLRKINKKYK